MRCFWLLLAAAMLTRAQDAVTRGKAIFERGVGRGPVYAATQDGEKVAASVLPCGGCHGSDGKGKREAGVAPSDITWNALTRSYAVSAPGGRTRGAYTERLLKRAFTAGVDASGNVLSAAMPRFQMSMDDAGDLMAYIRKLGSIAAAGVSEPAVRLGVAGVSGHDVSDVLLNVFREVNANGGIFGRSVELVPLQLPAEAAARGQAVRDWVAGQDVFAIACVDMTGAEPGIAAAIRDAEIPAIAGLAPVPQMAEPLNRWVFYLDSGGTDEPRRRAAAAAEMAVEALRRAGRDLTRMGFVEALETFSSVNSSLGRPVTFGPGRRLGAVDGDARVH